MSYQYTRFGTEGDEIALPTHNAEAQIDTFPARSGAITTIAGGYDNWGTQQAIGDFPYALTLRGMYTGTTLAALKTTLDSLRAKTRTQGRLYRRDEGNTISHWCTARLVRVGMTHTPTFPLWQEVECIFECFDHWRGVSHEAWTLDSGKYLDTGLVLDDTAWTATLSTDPYDLALTNGGNIDVFDPIITVNAVTNNITEIKITETARSDTELIYSGTISAGNSLVIDCGAFTIENNASGDYSNLTLGSSHSIAQWARLQPGSSTLRFDYTSVGSSHTATITFHDRWA